MDETPPTESNGQPVLCLEADSASAEPKRPASDEEWLSEYILDPTYTGIDVRREFGKLKNWCREHKKQPTRRRFVNWLNRADRTIQAGAPQGQDLQHALGELHRLEAAPRREKSDPGFPSKLEEAKKRVADLQGGKL